MRKKVVYAADAIALIDDGDTLTTSGFVGIGVPDALLAALEERYLATGKPRDLSLVLRQGRGTAGPEVSTGQATRDCSKAWLPGTGV